MIRILLTSGNKAYGYDITNWESKSSEWYDNLHLRHPDKTHEHENSHRNLFFYCTL